MKTLGWQRVPIKNTYLGLYDGVHGTPKPAEDGAVFLGIKNLTDDGAFDLSDIRHIAEDDYPKWTKRVTPRPGDIVFTYEATLNRYAIIPAGLRCCLGRRLALIRPNPATVDTRFLFYYFFSRDWRDTIKTKTLSGATVDRIPITTFPEFPVCLPPLPAQKKIAAILSAYDDLIENNERRIRILEEMAQNLYREWFVKFRFPGHKQVKMVDSPLGKIPQGWEVKRLDELVDFNPTLPLKQDADIPYVAMEGLLTNSMVVRITENRAKTGGARFQNGDTLFARITPCLENGKTGYVRCLPSDETVALGSTEFIVMRSSVLPSSFVYLLARSDSFRGTAIKSMSGATGRQRVQIESVRQYEMPTPGEAILQQFSGTVDGMFDQVYVLSRRNDLLRQTRDLLLPKLISGEVDVSELDIRIPESGA